MDFRTAVSPVSGTNNTRFGFLYSKRDWGSKRVNLKAFWGQTTQDLGFCTQNGTEVLKELIWRAHTPGRGSPDYHPAAPRTEPAAPSAVLGPARLSLTPAMQRVAGCVFSSVFSRVLYGAVFPIGSVRFGAVNLTATHRRIFASSWKTAPHRTAP